MKKFLGFLLVATLILGIGVPALAADVISGTFYSITNVVWGTNWDTPYNEFDEPVGLAGAEFVVLEGATLSFEEPCAVKERKFTDIVYLSPEEGMRWYWASDDVWLEEQISYALETNAVYEFSYGEGLDFMVITIIVVDNEMGANYIAQGEVEPDIDPEPEPAPAPISQPEALSVNPTPSTVYVNGESTAFEAYNINGNNYFKLRDLAFALNGSEKGFEIGYDSSTGAITMSSGQAYTAVGGEMAAGDGNAKSATLNSAINIAKDGESVEITAYLIDGNNFVKLRDVMKLFDVFVGYDDETKAITLETAESYAE